MTTQKHLEKASAVLTAIQAELMEFTMHIGESLKPIRDAINALDGNPPLDEIQAKLQTILDACPKFDPGVEVEPVRANEAEEE